VNDGHSNLLQTVVSHRLGRFRARHDRRRPPGGALMVNRTEAARRLAKAIAYKAVGKDAEARAWAAALVRQLECAEILTPDYVSGQGSVVPFESEDGDLL